MLAAVAALSGWLVYRAKVQNEIKAEALKVAEDISRQDEIKSLAEDAVAKELAIASHVYSHRGIEGPYEESFRAYDEVISAGSRNIEQDLVL